MRAKLRQAIAGAILAFGLVTPAAAQGVLNIYNWSDYIDEGTIKRFEAETGIKVRYDVYDSNEVLDAKLRAGRSGYDLVVPSASPFLARQIPANFYQPIDRSRVPNYGKLDPAIMRQIEKNDPGNKYAIPWMWGTTGIGYNAGRVLRIMGDAPVYSLKMIFDPAVVSRFKACGVIILDSQTDVIPAALAYLGREPDSKTPADLDAAIEVLTKIRPYVRKWHSSEYINDLANGDACLVFGYSGDIKQAARRAAETRKGVKIEYALPVEGTLLWFDTWAIPADARNVANAYRFLDFVLRPEIAALNTNFIGYANAVPESLPVVDPAIRNDPTVYPPEEFRRRFYTISPATRDYDRLRTRAWTRVTAGR
ncbi:MAG: polyamine ABC transporter substrate-binding protein [Rhodospirillales bacterium]|nr:polyamine ABC transporter substrate-binding protein [Rhodospirillales bacterium]